EIAYTLNKASVSIAIGTSFVGERLSYVKVDTIKPGSTYVRAWNGTGKGTALTVTPAIPGVAPIVTNWEASDRLYAMQLANPDDIANPLVEPDAKFWWMQPVSPFASWPVGDSCGAQLDGLISTSPRDEAGTLYRIENYASADASIQLVQVP